MSLLGSIATFAVRNNWPLLARATVFLGRMFGTDFAGIRVEHNNTLWHICPNENIGGILLPVAKASINVTNDHGHTALDIARTRNVRFQEFLVTNGAVFTTTFVEVEVPVAVAVTIVMPSAPPISPVPDLNRGLALHTCSTAAEVQGLVAAGADVLVRNSAGRAPIHSLQRNGRRDAVIALINAVASRRGVHAVVDLVNDQEGVTGKTPLHLAEWGPIVDLLLEKGARIDIPDSDGNFPLHIAISHNNYEGKDKGIIRALVAHGARYDEPNTAGRTAIDELRYRKDNPNPKGRFNDDFSEIVLIVLGSQDVAEKHGLLPAATVFRDSRQGWRGYGVDDRTSSNQRTYGSARLSSSGPM